MGAHLPFDHSEVYLELLKDVDCLVEELGVEEMTTEDYRGEADSAL